MGRTGRFRSGIFDTISIPTDKVTAEDMVDAFNGGMSFIEEDPYSISVTPRSMLDMISVASRFVDVPSEHTGIVPSLEPWHGDSTGSPPVMIRSSKMFLEAMVAAYTSRVGSMEATQDTPQVVLPVGG